MQRKAPPYGNMDHLSHGVSTADNPFGHIFALLLAARVKMEPSGSHWLLSIEDPCIGVVWSDEISFVFKFTIPPVT